MVSNVDHVSRFFEALLAGRVVSKTAVVDMEQTVPANTVFGLWQGDGLGIFSSHLRCGRFWGHDGGILDYLTIVEASLAAASPSSRSEAQTWSNRTWPRCCLVGWTRPSCYRLTADTGSAEHCPIPMTLSV